MCRIKLSSTCNYLKVLLLTITKVVKQNAVLNPAKKPATGCDFRNIPCRQGGTRGVRHLFYALKARGDGCQVGKIQGYTKKIGET